MLRITTTDSADKACIIKAHWQPFEELNKWYQNGAGRSILGVIPRQQNIDMSIQYTSMPRIIPCKTIIQIFSLYCYYATIPSFIYIKYFFFSTSYFCSVLSSEWRQIFSRICSYCKSYYTSKGVMPWTVFTACPCLTGTI